MRLKKLQIKNFRNLNNVELTPVSGVNVIFGQNASGKTSLLESIYYLSHLRSFRSKNINDLIQRDKEYLQLVSRITTKDNQEIPLGVSRSKYKLEVRANKKPVKRVADIASLFPVVSIHPDSYQLITGGPSERRSFIDWGVFHVEHSFFKAWQRYRVALNQRNAALKSKQDASFCMLWDKELAQSADIIDQLRKSYMMKLMPELQLLVNQFFPNQAIEFEYKRGWNNDEALEDLLKANCQKDRFKGFTYYGPHRSDLVIRVDGYSAQNEISRGQQKCLVALLKLAQAKHYSQCSKLDCVLLYDDLPAELDSTRKELVLSVLSDMKIQLFLTSIEPDQLDLSHWTEKRLFHVEQGILKSIKD